MKFRTPSDVTYQVLGILMCPERVGVLGRLPTICAARNSPELLPPSFPWLFGGQMMRRDRS